MVLLDAALLGVVLGLLLGGRLGRLAELELRSLRLAYAAVALQLIAFPEGVLPWTTPTTLARVVWLLSYACLILFLIRNVRVAGSPIIFAGLLCNLTAIIANGGLMPVIGGALRAAGRSYRVHNNSISLVHPRLAELVDRWAVPHWIPLGNVFSVGDVLIAAGTTLAVALALQPRRIRLPDRRLGPRNGVDATATADSGVV
jgi:hypothetical protein